MTHGWRSSASGLSSPSISACIDDTEAARQRRRGFGGFGASALFAFFRSRPRPRRATPAVETTASRRPFPGAPAELSRPPKMLCYISFGLFRRVGRRFAIAETSDRMIDRRFDDSRRRLSTGRRQASLLGDGLVA